MRHLWQSPQIQFKKPFVLSVVAILTVANSALSAQRGSADSKPPTKQLSDARVSTQELAVPRKSRKELCEAERLISQHRWPEALERLRHLVAKHPQYAAAYNSLGVVYFESGDISRAREALARAIEIDPQLSLAYLNLARLSIMQSDFDSAEALLSRAATFPPVSVSNWNLLAYAQLKAGHYDQALETCRQVHMSDLRDHSFVHLVAALIYIRKDQPPDVVAELKQYISEDPDGSYTAEARRAIADLGKSRGAFATSAPIIPP